MVGARRHGFPCGRVLQAGANKVLRGALTDRRCFETRPTPAARASLRVCKEGMLAQLFRRGSAVKRGVEKRCDRTAGPAGKGGGTIPRAERRRRAVSLAALAGQIASAWLGRAGAAEALLNPAAAVIGVGCALDIGKDCGDRSHEATATR